MTTTRIWAAAAGLVLALTACGGGGGVGSDLTDLGTADSADTDELDDFAEALNEAQGAGGGGTLTFDGQEFTIDSAVCVNQGGRIDVGTVGPEGNRVFVTGQPDDLGLQVLSAEGIQWFDGDPFQQNKPTVTISGSTITSTGGTFFNNQDDRLIVIEFVIECPNALL